MTVLRSWAGRRAGTSQYDFRLLSCLARGSGGIGRSFDYDYEHEHDYDYEHEHEHEHDYDYDYEHEKTGSRAIAFAATLFAFHSAFRIPHSAFRIRFHSAFRIPHFPQARYNIYSTLGPVSGILLTDGTARLPDAAVSLRTGGRAR